MGVVVVTRQRTREITPCSPGFERLGNLPSSKTKIGASKVLILGTKIPSPPI